MTNEELKKLDFNLATLQMLRTDTAMLKTVLQNQMTIMEALNLGTNAQITIAVNQRLQENLKTVDEDLKRMVPESIYLQFPKN